MKINLKYKLKLGEFSDKYIKESSLASWVKSSLAQSGRFFKRYNLLVEADGREISLAKIVRKSRGHYESAHCALEMFCGNRLVNRKFLRAYWRALAPGYRCWAMSNALLHSAKHINSMNCNDE